MPKKNIGVRLEEETIKILEKRGKASTVIRNIVLESFNPPPPPKIVEKIKEVEVEVEKEIEVIKLVDTGSQGLWGIWQSIFEDVIRDEISRGLPEFYTDMRIEDFEKTYGVKWRDLE